MGKRDICRPLATTLRRRKGEDGKTTVTL